MKISEWKFFKKCELARNGTTNFEEWYRWFEVRISESANIEGCKYRGIPVFTLMQPSTVMVILDLFYSFYILKSHFSI